MNRLLPALWVALALALGVAAPQATRAAATRPAPAGAESVAAAAAVSQFRRENGLNAVVSDPQLVAAAQTQADAMAKAGVMSHEIGGSFPTRIRAAGIRAGISSENVAMGQVSLQDAMASWKASSGHRKNMLTPSATRIGFARARGADGRLYWALILASPEPKPGRPLEAGGPHQWGPPPPWLGLLGR